MLPVPLTTTLKNTKTCYIVELLKRKKNRCTRPRTLQTPKDYEHRFIHCTGYYHNVFLLEDNWNMSDIIIRK